MLNETAHETEITAEDLEYELMLIGLSRELTDAGALSFAATVMGTFFRNRLLTRDQKKQVGNVFVHPLLTEEIGFIRTHSLQTAMEMKNDYFRQLGNAQWSAMVSAITKLEGK